MAESAILAASVISYGFAALAFLLFSLLLAVSRRKGDHTPALMLASLGSFLWACAYLVLSFKPIPILLGSGLPDTFRILAWTGFLHSIMHRGQAHSRLRATPARSPKWLSGGHVHPWAISLLLIQIIVVWAGAYGIIDQKVIANVLPIIWILVAVSGLYMLERLYTSTQIDRRARLRYLCVGLGAMFLFDFYLFTNSLLFKVIPLNTWQARGAVYGLLVPLVGLSVARNPDWAVRLHVSRQAVTSSVTLLAAGGYLLATAFAASLIRFGQVEGASVWQVTFILLSVVVLVLVLLSRRLRAQSRVFVSKHFFNFKYDYRREWLKYTETLACDINRAPAAIVEGLCNIVESESGELWRAGKSGQFELLIRHGGAPAKQFQPHELESLSHFLSKTKWLIDLEEFKQYPDRFENLELPPSLKEDKSAWLIIPLPFVDDIVGFVLLDKSPVIRGINWEDRDLLKTAGHQAAGLLAQRNAHQALQEASQFEAFSRLSAYIVHDLKNILGQQSLIVSNAEKHKHNPAFVDDVIKTVDNSVNRMRSLLQQIREPEQQPENSSVHLNALLQTQVSSHSGVRPIPQLICSGDVHVQAAAEKLTRVFGHIIQNAQEATAETGKVDVHLRSDNKLAWIDVSDTGIGMNQEFITGKLFTAFESTKGLTGMGIGVYESREYIRSLGGNIAVISTPGEGSTFTITIPID